MKIKLTDKDNPMSLSCGWCFKNDGFDMTLIEELNSGKQVVADKIPKPAREYVSEVTVTKTKENKGDK
tara:strand:- start:1050 stop:1253 length:204 start_codon:yes stop_codon:yes gene_type:complete